MLKILAIVCFSVSALGALALPGRLWVLSWAPWPTLLLWPLAVTLLFWDRARTEARTSEGSTSTSRGFGPVPWLVALGTLFLALVYWEPRPWSLSFNKPSSDWTRAPDVQVWSAPTAGGGVEHAIYTRTLMLPLWSRAGGFEGRINAAAVSGRSLFLDSDQGPFHLDLDTGKGSFEAKE